MNRLHFISGLPRSGSTLLSAILRQVPTIHAGMTSPVGSLVMSLQRAMSPRNETAIFVDHDQRRRMLHGLFDSYYKDFPQSTIFDTNRLWCGKLPLLKELFGEIRVICCVREVSWILDSIESITRRNPLELSGLFGYEPGGTVYSRVNSLAGPGGLVGGSLDSLREAFYGPDSGCLMLVDYERLCKEPRRTISQIYEWLGLPAFDHDFDDVSYEAHDFDSALGTPGLHTVRKKVEWIERPAVLPLDVSIRFCADNFWRDPEPRTHARILA